MNTKQRLRRLLLIIVAVSVGILASRPFVITASAQQDRPYWRGGFSGQSADRFIVEDKYGTEKKKSSEKEGEEDEQKTKMYPIKKMGSRKSRGYSSDESDEEALTEEEAELLEGEEAELTEEEEAELVEETDLQKEKLQTE